MLRTQYSEKNRMVFDHFSLDFKHLENHTNISMNLFTPWHTTKALPHTSSYLEKFLPSIFNSQCFNSVNAPFRIEVINTEIAHLFEHIMLVHLYDEKIQNGASFVKYDGITSWKISSPLLSDIKLNVGQKDSEIFKRALDKSVKLLVDIISETDKD